MSSVSFGGLVSPPLYRYPLDFYGLKGTILILLGLMLNVVSLAGLLNRHLFFCTLSERNVVQIGETHKYSPVPTGKTRSLSLSKGMLPGNGVSTCFEMEAAWISLPDWPDDAGECLILSPSIQHLGSTNAVFSLSQTQLGNLKQIMKKKIIDISLFKKPLLQLYLFVYLFGSIGSAYGLIFISPFARDHGITTNDISILISVTNMCDFTGRCLCGIIANQHLVKNL